MSVELAPRASEADPERLVGRDDELAELVRLARHESVVQLIGPAGVGKSELAAAALKELRGYDMRARVYLGLTTNLRDAERLTLHALGVPRTNLAPDEQLRRYLRSRSVAILFDSVESTRGLADLLERSLTASPSSRFFVTSRKRLLERDYATIELKGLAFHGNPDVSPATHLFVGAFGGPPSTIDPETIERIASRCGGSPLLLRLAAAVATRAGVPAVRDAMPAPPSREAAQLEFLLERYWATLPAEARTACSELANYSFTFDEETARSVTPGGLDLVRELRRAGLLIVIEDGAFGMHDVFREFARRNDGDPAGSRDRHARACLTRIPEPSPPESATDGARRAPLAREVPELVAAFRHAVTKLEPETFARAAPGLATLLYRRGEHADGLEAFRAAVGRIDDLSERNAAMVLHALGVFERAMGMTKESLETLTRASMTAEAAGEPAVAVDVETDYWYGYGLSVGIPAAVDGLRQVASRAHRSGWTRLESRALLFKAMFDNFRRDPTEARASCERALELARDSRDAHLEAIALAGYVPIIAGIEGIEAAEPYIDAGLHRLRALDLKVTEAALHVNAGQQYKASLAFRTSRAHFRAAVRLKKEVGAIHASDLTELAELQALCGNLQEAYELVDEALLDARARERTFEEMWALLVRGHVEMLLGRLEHGARDLRAAEAHADRLESRSAQNVVRVLLYRCRIECGDLDEAVDVLGRAIGLEQHADVRHEDIEVRTYRAEIAWMRGAKEEAQRLLASVLPRLSPRIFRDADRGLYVLSTAVRLLQRLGDVRWQEILEMAHIESIRQSEQFEGEERRMFLEGHPVRRALLDEYRRVRESQWN